MEESTARPDAGWTQDAEDAENLPFKLSADQSSLKLCRGKEDRKFKTMPSAVKCYNNKKSSIS
jgi:hypothetical protein